jgi:GT2 family glycosyltransferase
MPTYNRVDLLARCLASPGLASLRDKAEFVVADNGSTDGTAEYLAAQPFVRAINLPAGTSFARSCNTAAAVSASAYLVFLNNDMLLSSGWLEPFIAWLDNPDVGAVGSVLRYPSGDIQHAGVRFCARGLPGNLRLPRRTFNTQHVFLQAVTGAALAIKTNTFNRIGRFDERFRNSYEDVDLCLRLRRVGKRNVLLTTPEILHLESQTDGRHAHDDSNLRAFVAKCGTSAVPDARRLLARLQGAASPVAVMRLRSSARHRERRCTSSDAGAVASPDHAIRAFLGRSGAERILLCQGDAAAMSSQRWPARTPVSYWGGAGELVGLAFTRRQLEHVGLPCPVTLGSLLERLRRHYVDAGARTGVASVA